MTIEIEIQGLGVATVSREEARRVADELAKMLGESEDAYVLRTAIEKMEKMYANARYSPEFTAEVLEAAKPKFEPGEVYRYYDSDGEVGTGAFYGYRNGEWTWITNSYTETNFKPSPEFPVEHWAFNGSTLSHVVEGDSTWDYAVPHGDSLISTGEADTTASAAFNLMALLLNNVRTLITAFQSELDLLEDGYESDACGAVVAIARGIIES